MSEPEVSHLLTVRQAIDILDAASVAPRAVRVGLDDALGLRLAEDIVADRDAPAFEKSLMDGFAVRCADLVHTPLELPVAGTIAAGSRADSPLPAGAVMAIMTGAPLPDGADGVVPVEDTTRLGEKRVRIERAAVPRRYIAARGSDIRAGAIVLMRGTKLAPAQLAVAASVGASNVNVFARPRAGVMTTGDEIVPIDQSPGPAQLRNCNSTMLAALLDRLGCDATNLGIVRDDPNRIREAIAAALREFDLLFVTGGMSMGEFDFVPRVLIELGVELKITKLRIKPGKPFVFGVAPSAGSAQSPRYVFGLPGNPVSSFACTLRLCSRLIARLGGGAADEAERWRYAILSDPLGENGPREFYQPAILANDGTLRPLDWKGSADIYTLARANALLVRVENEAAQQIGARVRVLEIPT